MRWLLECSEAAVREAVAVVAPGMRDEPVTLSSRTPVGGPQWWASSAAVGERHVAKFAWSKPAAVRLRHEIEVLRALDPLVRCLPRVAASSLDPLLLIVERVDGASLFEVVDSLDPDDVGAQLAAFLADLHRPEVRAHLVNAIDTWPEPPGPLPTDEVRQRLGRWARPDQVPLINRWCDWADRVLAAPGESVVVHGDFHGDNQVWADGRLQVVLDFETVALAEPEYDFRGVSSVGPSVDLLVRTMAHYRQRDLSVERVMGWHVRTVLGDLLWRSEAGIGAGDGRTAPEWLDDLAARLRRLGIGAGG